MAIVKLPLLSEKASGSFGENLVFKRSRGMNIVSQRPDSSGQISTPRQTKVRSIMAELAALQRTLTPAQLKGWEALSDYKPSSVFGLPVQKSAINNFIQVNFYRRDRDLTANLSAPISPMKGNISALNVINKSSSPGTVIVSWTLPTGAAVADAVDIWFAGPLDTLTRKAQAKDFHHKIYTAGNLITQEIAGMTLDKYYYFRARFVMVDGRTENFLISSALLIA